MTWVNEASPCINSANPGAFGSTETAEIVGEVAVRSTTMTLALCAIRRAMVSAVRVMLSLEAVPRMVTLRAATPAASSFSASCSTSDNSDSISGASGTATDSTAAFDSITGTDSIAGLDSAANLGSTGAAKTFATGSRSGADTDTNAAAARGIVIRSNSPVTINPLDSIRVASVAISTIGSFFG